MAESAGGSVRTYNELLSRICSTLLRPDLAQEAMGWIESTESELYRDCDVRAGDQTKTGTLAAGADTIAVPDGMIELRHGYVTFASKSVPLKVASLDRIMERRNGDTSGRPELISLQGDVWEIAPVADGTGTQAYKLWYYGTPEPISDGNPTNTLFKLGPDAYLYGALMHGAVRIANPERLGLYEPKFMAAKESLRAAYWRSRLPATLEMKTDFSVDDQHLRH